MIADPDGLGDLPQVFLEEGGHGFRVHGRGQGAGAGIPFRVHGFKGKVQEDVASPGLGLFLQLFGKRGEGQESEGEGKVEGD